jgi:hypothetical protein
LNGKIGQSNDNQINCLAGIDRYFNNAGDRLWRMQNGYCFPSEDGLREVENRLLACEENELDSIRGRLSVGVQKGTQITIGQSNHLVTQVFCSALPISYSEITTDLWNLFPRLILDATYEATFWIAVQNMMRTGCRKLFLTLVGGGVFGNRIEWIISSICRSLKLFSKVGLDVGIVSYGRSKPEVADLIARYVST